MSRREQIETMLKDDPSDVFLRYALGMELKKAGEVEAAVAKMHELTLEAKPHVPAFFMAAQYQAELGEVESSREYLRHGIEHAREQGDLHAASEMREFLQTLGEM